MLSDSLRQEILDLMDRYGPETVMKAAEIAADGWCKEQQPSRQLDCAIKKAERALEKLHQAGNDEKLLWAALDDLDWAAYNLRSTVGAISQKGVG